MNWMPIMSELLKKLTLQEVADRCGMASKGHVHDLATGRQRSVSYDVGDKLMQEYKRIMRRRKT